MRQMQLGEEERRLPLDRGRYDTALLKAAEIVLRAPERYGQLDVELARRTVTRCATGQPAR